MASRLKILIVTTDQFGNFSLKPLRSIHLPRLCLSVSNGSRSFGIPQTLMVAVLQSCCRSSTMGFRPTVSHRPPQRDARHIFSRTSRLSWRRSWMLMAAGVLFLLMQNSSPMQAASVNAPCAPKILVLRGIFEVFSLGMDDLAVKLRCRGYDVTVTSWALALMEIDCCDARPLVVVGHSLGGRMCAWVSREMGSYGRRVPLIIVLDSNVLQTIPGNVDRCLNLYVTNGLGLFHGGPVYPEAPGTEIVNWDVSQGQPSLFSGGVNHFDIDSTVWVQQIIIDEIEARFRPAVKRPFQGRSFQQRIWEARQASPLQPGRRASWGPRCPESGTVSQGRLPRRYAPGVNAQSDSFALRDSGPLSSSGQPSPHFTARFSTEPTPSRRPRPPSRPQTQKTPDSSEDSPLREAVWEPVALREHGAEETGWRPAHRPRGVGAVAHQSGWTISYTSPDSTSDANESPVSTIGHAVRGRPKQRSSQQGLWVPVRQDDPGDF